MIIQEKTKKKGVGKRECVLGGGREPHSARGGWRRKPRIGELKEGWAFEKPSCTQQEQAVEYASAAKKEGGEISGKSQEMSTRGEALRKAAGRINWGGDPGQCFHKRKGKKSYFQRTLSSTTGDDLPRTALLHYNLRRHERKRERGRLPISLPARSTSLGRSKCDKVTLLAKDNLGREVCTMGSRSKNAKTCRYQGS